MFPESSNSSFPVSEPTQACQMWMISNHLTFFLEEGVLRLYFPSVELQLTSEVPAGPSWSLCGILGIGRSPGGVVCLIGVGEKYSSSKRTLPPSFCFIFYICKYNIYWWQLTPQTHMNANRNSVGRDPGSQVNPAPFLSKAGSCQLLQECSKARAVPQDISSHLRHLSPLLLWSAIIWAALPDSALRGWPSDSPHPGSAALFIAD